jgi:hypothetical protein
MERKAVGETEMRLRIKRGSVKDEENVKYREITK